jgi:hypothetical protein
VKLDQARALLGSRHERLGIVDFQGPETRSYDLSTVSPANRQGAVRASAQGSRQSTSLRQALSPPPATEFFLLNVDL